MYGFFHTTPINIGRKTLNWPVTKPAVMDSEVVAPSEMIAIGDGYSGNSKALYFGESTLWRQYTVIGNDSFETTVNDKRHQGKANVVFCDGHVDRPRCNFSLKTPATRPWRVGIATISRIAKNCRIEAASPAH